jgi:hypothetical protein
MQAERKEERSKKEANEAAAYKNKRKETY